ncbi:MAG TPA: hypothetical protein VHM92_06540 [Allosphingosinicella sp.]|nr:hypothetical protein [Allosphingosinicella sp.]
MAGIERPATQIASVALLAASLFLWPASAHAAPVRTGGAACALAKSRVAAHLHRSRSSIPGCETIDAAYSPRGFYVLALRGWCREEVCGSTLIGWFAVEKRNGRLFEWDVAELRLGRPIGR